MKLLVKGLVRIMRVLGRWVLRDLEQYGVARLIGYMEIRVGVFRERLKRARSKARQRWLVGRIQRWRSAIRWLQQHSPRISRKVARAVEQWLEENGERIADRVVHESFVRWHAATRKDRRRNRRRRAARSRA